MISNEIIRNASMCRSCLSKSMHVKLEREDCAYFAYQATCSKCHQFKNIVVGVKLNKRLFAHNEFH